MRKMERERKKEEGGVEGELERGIGGWGGSEDER